jgi:crotonobetainyl-CoA:carnitine CoA-transferase CaiB-like acyl-CoA transferase
VRIDRLDEPQGRRDVGPGISLSDHLSGLAAALAILEALEARRRSGHGQHIELSQLEVGAYLVGPAYVDELTRAVTARAAGNRDAFEDPVPNEVYRCRDEGWLAITARDDAEWQSLCAAVGDAALAGDGALATVAGRRRARAIIDARLAAWAEGREAEAAMRLLQARGVPAGRVQGARELIEEDEHLLAGGCAGRTSHGTIGRQRVDCFPALFDGAAVEPPRASPALGEHNFEVYAELLGLSEAEVAEAIADGLLALKRAPDRAAERAGSGRRRPSEQPSRARRDGHRARDRSPRWGASRRSVRSRSGRRSERSSDGGSRARGP